MTLHSLGNVEIEARKKMQFTEEACFKWSNWYEH